MAFFVPSIALAPVKCHSPVRRDVAPFLSFLDNTFKELNQASRSHSHRPQPVVRHRFDVRETDNSYEVDGELPGFKQQDIDIEFPDDQTLIIKGRSEETSSNHVSLVAPRAVDSAKTEVSDETDQPATSYAESDSSSVKSYQATVEDDFEDLGDEGDNKTSKFQDKTQVTEPETGVSKPQSTHEPKQKHQQPQAYKWVSERNFGYFSRTFSFPLRVNTGATTASLQNGVLSLVIPKAPAQQTRRIQIA